MVESAGLVILYDNKILLAHPKGQKWFGTYSIPKGCIEDGEDKITAALRETKEEIGVEFIADQIDPTTEGYITYTNTNGEIYKKVYFYIITLNEPLQIDKNKLQKDEIDWAGFLTKEEAKKRIFWRFARLLINIK